MPKIFNDMLTATPLYTRVLVGLIAFYFLAVKWDTCRHLRSIWDASRRLKKLSKIKDPGKKFIFLRQVDHLSTMPLGASWVRPDEWYNYSNNPRARVNVLLRLNETSYTSGGIGSDHPSAWYHDYEGGRSWLWSANIVTTLILLYFLRIVVASAKLK